MRIGIYAQVVNEQGGVFRYTRTFLDMLRALDSEHEFVLLYRRRSGVPLDQATGEGWSSARMPSRVVDLVRDMGVGVAGEPLARRVWYAGARLRPDSIVRDPGREPPFDRVGARWYRERGLDLVLYPVYSTRAFETRVPCMVTVHDLNHRVYDEFPEVRAFGEFERREYYFRNACRHALTLFVDSEAGRDDLFECYPDTGLTRDRVVVLPTLPAPAVTPDVDEADRARVRERYRLSLPFLFYPAQFWPHKNHRRLIEALFHLKHDAGLRPTLVLAGASSGAWQRHTFAAVMRAALRLGVHAQVRCLGFVPDEDMSPLYAEAAALVMPTFFGPTNIPVWEAFALGCPVVTSDLRGIREQTDGAAILVDPRNPLAIADGLERVLTREAERSALIRRGREVLSRHTPERYQAILRRALGDAMERLGGPLNFSHGVHHGRDVVVAQSGRGGKIQAASSQI